MSPARRSRLMRHTVAPLAALILAAVVMPSIVDAVLAAM